MGLCIIPAFKRITRKKFLIPSPPHTHKGLFVSLRWQICNVHDILYYHVTLDIMLCVYINVYILVVSIKIKIAFRNMMSVLGVMAHVCNFSILEVDTRRWGGSRELPLCGEFEASLHHMNLVSRTNSVLARWLRVRTPGPELKPQKPHEGGDQLTPNLPSDFHICFMVLKSGCTHAHTRAHEYTNKHACKCILIRFSCLKQWLYLIPP